MNLELPDTVLNILLADDDLDDRFFFDKVLKEIPISTSLKTVNNGEQLMIFLNENLQKLPDVLFLDLSMPRKTGFECLSEIKENINLRHLKVIMFTTSFTRGADLEENLKSTLLKMGARDYIRKPNEYEELKKVIHNALLKIIENVRTVEKTKNT
jgi:CheY-like chemotaxis protein